MAQNKPFLQKLISRFEHIDKKSVQDYVLSLAEETEIFRNLLNELSEGVILTDEQGAIQLINRQAALWLGIPADPKGKASVLGQIVPDTDARHFFEKVVGLRQKMVKDLHILSPQENFLRISMSPLPAERKKYVLILLLNQTHTMHEQISEARLARIEALISLAAGVAHEIGNPLNSLSIHLELLKHEIEKLPKEKQKLLSKTLVIMKSETGRLDRIVKNFLQAARKKPLRFRPENLNTLTEEVLNVLRPEFSAAKVKIRFDPDHGLPAFLLDRDRLYQVFINLFKNALEAMPGGGTLTVRLNHREKVATIYVKDTGTGIPEADLPYIFDAYFTTKEGGSGLGLMTVYDGISEHGGKIEVESKAGKGTLFKMLIPIRRPQLQLPKYEPAALKNSF